MSRDIDESPADTSFPNSVLDVYRGKKPRINSIRDSEGPGLVNEMHSPRTVDTIGRRPIVKSLLPVKQHNLQRSVCPFIIPIVVSRFNLTFLFL